MTQLDLAHALSVVTQAVLEAGALLRAEFHRPGGPRGESGTCPADAEAERLLRDHLRREFPSHGIIGEELASEDVPASDDDHHVWLIDPNDGTSPFQAGFRGAAVSLGLLRDGVPVLGVVYAHSAPDDDGDLFTWAEGQPLLRNGVEVRRTWPSEINASSIVLVSHHADERPLLAASLVYPARFRPMPSIAYRLALAAAGDGDVGVSLNAPGALDVVGGHALLLGAGADLYDDDGRPRRYTREGKGGGNCFGGVAWQRDTPRETPQLPPHEDPTRRLSRDIFARLEPGQTISDAGQLRRAQGCLLGQLVGDSLGSLVEFESTREIAQKYPNGVRHLADGGTWGTLAGQPTDDSELALSLARSLLKKRAYDPLDALEWYVRWYRSDPFDMGGTTARALGAASRAFELGSNPLVEVASHALTTSQANGALMRVSPLGIFGVKLDPRELWQCSLEDAMLTHPHVVCQYANAVFTHAISIAVREGLDARSVWSRTIAFAQQAGTAEHAPVVLEMLEGADKAPPDDFMTHQGWVLVALRNAFYQLLHAPTFEEGVVDSVMRGGDTDTNAAIAGALLGAVHGREAIPRSWRNDVLTCRALPVPGVKHPRPPTLWPIDAMTIAEKLML
ncbi:MAG: inositol monophosphatase family protein [Polyangiaceae bacterium]